ncbi:MAG: carboxypeptidase-like regulatory domain-containing protein, partial [Planctomycetota bacterium]
IINIVAGDYQVEFDHTNYPASRVNDVKVELDQTTVIDTETLKIGASLEGTIFNDANSPLPNAKVSIRNKANTFTRTATADQNGYYKITNIPPGTYRVSPIPAIDLTRNPFEILGPALQSEVIDVEIREGENKQLTLIIYS